MRTSGLVVLGATLLLVGSALGQGNRRCPWNPQASIQMYLSSQRQVSTHQRAINTQMRSLSVQQRNVTTQRLTNTTHTRMNTTTTVRRNTTVDVRQRAIPQRNIVQRTERTAERYAIVPPGRGGGGRGPVITGTRQTVKRNTAVEQRNTSVTDVRKTSSATRLTSSTPRQTHHVARQTGIARLNPNITTVRKTHSEQRKEMVERHSPHVQVRIKMNMTCGRCHNCPQDRAVQMPPQRLPRLQGPNPGPNLPRVVQMPGPSPVTTRPTPRLPPAVARPGPDLDRFVRRPPPRPDLNRFVPRPLPPVAVVSLPPSLPPLPRAVATPRTPLESLLTPERPSERSPVLPRMVGRGPEGKPPSAVAETPDLVSLGKTALSSLPGIAPPPLKGLEGTAVQINPLLSEGKMTVLRAAAAPPLLPPEAILEAPPLAPLECARHLERGLLPTLLMEDSSELETLEKAEVATRLELVLEAPPLPPLPDILLR